MGALLAKLESQMDLSALKDGKTTLPGLAMICITVLILAGKISVNEIMQQIPWEYVLALIFGGGGATLLGAKSRPAESIPQEANLPPVPNQAFSITATKLAAEPGDLKE